MEKQIVVAALGALAQETRLDVFRALVQAGPEGMPAGAIGETLDIPSATLSFHLKELKSTGLIRCERQGRSRIYSPDFAVVGELLSFLTENCCQEGSAAGVELGCAPARSTVQPRTSLTDNDTDSDNHTDTDTDTDKHTDKHTDKE